jgi:hypothetical protein
MQIITVVCIVQIIVKRHNKRERKREFTVACIMQMLRVDVEVASILQLLQIVELIGILDRQIVLVELVGILG